jgi:hypothetical protein
LLFRFWTGDPKVFSQRQCRKPAHEHMPARLDAVRPGFRFAVGDFDNNGLPDIAVLSAGKVELFLNRGR